MDGYTITSAAKLLGTTRQTIYNHVKKKPDQYTTLTADGKTMITLQGLAMLKETLRNRPGPSVKAVVIDKAATRQTLTDEIDRLTKETAIHAAENIELSKTVTDLSRQVETLKADKAYLQAALDKALDRHMTLFDRIVKRLMPGKNDQAKT